MIRPTPEPAHLQMALDEVLLTSVAVGRRPPTLRFWELTEPVLVLGSHQSVRNEVDRRQAQRHGFAIARRMSGGGTMLLEPQRSVIYSIYVPDIAVRGLTFVQSFAFLDAWTVAALQELGVPAMHRPINDIVSPRGKIGGAAQARRRQTVLHHTAMAYAMDVELVPQLIRIGRPRLSAQGLRSAEKHVSPLADLVGLSQPGLVNALLEFFAKDRQVSEGCISAPERADAEALVAAKYSRPEWINRLP